MGDERSTGLDTQLSGPGTPVSVDTEHESDVESLATTVPETVMAEQVTKDVVKEAQSVGRPAPIDDTASTTSTPAVNGETPSGPATINSTTSEPTSTATNTTSADITPADHVHVSDRPIGAAAAVCIRCGKRHVLAGSNRHRRRASKSPPPRHFRTQINHFSTVTQAT
jgi:hypothetical protein